MHMIFAMVQGLQELTWLNNLAPRVWILSWLAQSQKKKKKTGRKKNRCISFSPLSIIFLIPSWKPKKNMFWLYLQIYLIILECWTTFYLWKRTSIMCLLFMKLASLQGLPLWDTRHKGAARAKMSLFCLASGTPTCMAPPLEAPMHSGVFWCLSL